MAQRLFSFFIVFYINLIVYGIPRISDLYSYPVPPPVQFDEPFPSPPPPPLETVPQLIPTYLPPNVYPPIGTSPPIQNDVLPPLDDSVVISSPPNQYLGRQAPVQIFNMSCLNSGDGNGYFRTILRSTLPTKAFPVMETTSSTLNDCIITSTTSDTYRIDLEGPKLAECGIRACGTKMCLILRMATIPELKLAEDILFTLQCAPQETIVSKTKNFRLNTQNEQLGRSNTRTIPVASGGSQRGFEPQITLLRRNSGSNVFDQPIQQGNAVRLGDDLLLRASIRDGDGWRNSHLGAVIVRSSTSQKSVILVDENGCRNPAVRSICPQQPQQINALTIQLPFKAFLFQGAPTATDLLLSVRMSGCLRPRDCYQTKICDNDNGKVRVTRAVNFTDEITDWESEFEFRVLPTEGNHRQVFNDHFLMNNKKNSTAFSPLLFVIIILLCLMGILMVAFVVMKTLKNSL